MLGLGKAQVKLFARAASDLLGPYIQRGQVKIEPEPGGGILLRINISEQDGSAIGKLIIRGNWATWFVEVRDRAMRRVRPQEITVPQEETQAEEPEEGDDEDDDEEGISD